MEPGKKSALVCKDNTNLSAAAILAENIQRFKEVVVFVFHFFPSYTNGLFIFFNLFSLLFFPNLSFLPFHYHS